VIDFCLFFKYNVHIISVPYEMTRRAGLSNPLKRLAGVGRPELNSCKEEWFLFSPPCTDRRSMYQSGRRLKLSTHVHLAPILRMLGTISSLASDILGPALHEGRTIHTFTLHAM
jgi:hypothetical protein